MGVFWSYKEITEPMILYDHICVANWNLSIIVCAVWSQQQDATPVSVQPAKCSVCILFCEPGGAICRGRKQRRMDAGTQLGLFLSSPFMKEMTPCPTEWLHSLSRWDLRLPLTVFGHLTDIPTDIPKDVSPRWFQIQLSGGQTSTISACV